MPGESPEPHEPGVTAHQSLGEEETEEIAIVHAADAAVGPHAVMVEAVDAVVTNSYKEVKRSS